MKYQPNIPSELFNKFIENLGYMPEGQSVLVVRDIYTACYLSINNEVTFVSDDPEAISMFINTVIVNPEFGTNDSYIFVKENTNTEWLNTIDRIVKDMKFDVAIMNPPYDKSLHLKILEKVIDHANEVINISPVRWLQDPLAKYKKMSDYHKYEETISKKIESLDIIDAKISNELFNISNFGALGIYKIGKNIGYDYDLPAKEYLGNGYSICNKVLKRYDKLYNHMQKGTVGICVKVAEIRGFGSGKNFDIVSLIHSEPYINGDKYKDSKFKKKDVMTKNVEDELFVKVNTIEEGKNFIDSTRTMFHHFLIKCWKMDQHVPLKFLPWMRDYTKPWTNSRFCKYFGITGYIDDEHAEPDSEWETILKTME